MRSFPTGDPGPKGMKGSNSSSNESLSNAGISGAAAGPNSNNKIVQMKPYGLRETRGIVFLGGQNLPDGLPCDAITFSSAEETRARSSAAVSRSAVAPAASSSASSVPPSPPYDCPDGSLYNPGTPPSPLKNCSPGVGGVGGGTGPGTNIQSMCSCYFTSNYYAGPVDLPTNPPKRTGAPPCLPCNGAYLASTAAASTGRR